MPSPLKGTASQQTIPRVTVGHFFTQHGETLQLRLLAGAKGLQREIVEGAVNRPGLQLAGFYKYFANDRVQIIGSGEVEYLKSLSAATSKRRLQEVFRHQIPCLLLSRRIKPTKVLLEVAEEEGVPLFQSPLTTMRLMNATTICLEQEFAPQVSEHGSMVDIQGMGVMIRGASGVGKSECVLSLLHRGHSLVSDDITRIRCFESRELIGTSPELTRFFMEVRGIGIINVATLFGVRSIRMDKRLDLVVTLKEWNDVPDVDRLGLDQDYYQILTIRVPHVTIPVKPGRDMATLVEVAALDQKLKAMGQNTAQEFNERLLAAMQQKSA